MKDKHVLDTAYVVYFPDTDEYFGSNVGLYRTKQGAERRAEFWKRMYNCEVRKVELVLVEEE